MTTNETLRARALAFRSLHVPGRPLVLPNAWDVTSARIVEDAGAAAVATTSAGLAWALGAADGDRLDRAPALGAVARIAAAVDVPVSADIESGYAPDPAGVATTIRAVIKAGAVGVNIEDALYEAGTGPLRPVKDQAERIIAAREAADALGVPLFVNVRIDTFLRGAGGVDLTLERAAAFVAAGADGIFVPGAVDPGVVGVLADGIEKPLNVMAGPGAPPVAVLAALGVARVSVGSGIAQAAHALVRRAAGELLGAGTYDSLAGGLDYGELNSLMGGGRQADAGRGPLGGGL
ncbi:isocitrate lyase/PEP mutase family protein [Streptomyces sp. AF1B]|jgi:2-methylisocitrate lyase-like PEP mutase family enzyme|uniref:isocitrate lyase/PEP mutase family protein n=1 Tax=Streptomyces sp. AF1B TaxID=3399503 RepID=UPI003AAD20BA